MSGNRAVIVVPSAAPLSTLSSPPIIAARSRIPTRPKLPRRVPASRSAVASRSNPSPSSITRSSAHSSPTRSFSCTEDASLCRRTLVNAS